jgi:hypothetical protein
VSQLLRVTGGDAAGAEIEVAAEFLIGRAAEGDGSLGGDAELSREHARITRGAGGLTIEDLGSTNGTFVNDTRIAAPTPIQIGDKISLGGSALLVAGTVPPDQATAERPVGGPAPVQATHVREVPSSPAAAPGPPPAAPPQAAPPGPPTAPPPAPPAAPPAPAAGGPPPGVTGPPPGAAGPPPGVGGPPAGGGMPPAIKSRMRRMMIIAAVIAFLVGFAIATVVWKVL